MLSNSLNEFRVGRSENSSLPPPPASMLVKVCVQQQRCGHNETSGLDQGSPRLLTRDGSGSRYWLSEAGSALL